MARSILIDIIGRDKASRAFDTSAASAEAAAKKMTGTSGKIAAVGSKLTKAVALPMAAVVAVSLAQATQFQKNNTLLQTAGGETVKKMSVIEGGLKKMAGDVGDNLNDLGNGMYIVAKAGAEKWSAVGQLQVLKAAAQGAKAENVDLATSTNALTSVMMSYHLGTAKAVATENQLIVGAGMAKTTMQNYAGSLATVIPIASAAGIKFEQVAGAVATLTQHGTSADEATQELAFTIRSLQAPNSVAQKAMQQLGLSVTDVSKNLGKRGLTGTIDMITNAIQSKMGPSGLVVTNIFKQSQSASADLNAMLGKMPKNLKALSSNLLSGKVGITEYTKAAKSLGGQSGAAALQFLALYKSSQGFNDLVKSGQPAAQTFAGYLNKVMGGATGLNTALQLGGENMAYFQAATDKVAAAGQKAGTNISTWAKTQNTLAVKTDQAKAKLQVMAVNLGTALIPVALKVVGVVSSVVTWFSHLSSGTQGLIVKIALAAAVSGPLITILTRLYGTGKLLVTWAAVGVMSMARFVAGVRMTEISLAGMQTKSYAAGLGLRTALAGGAAEGEGALAGMTAGAVGATLGIAALAVGVGYASYKLGQWLNKPSATALAFWKILKNIKAVEKSLEQDLVATSGKMNATTASALALNLQQNGLAAKAAKSHISLTQLTAGLTGTDKQFNALVKTWKASGHPSKETILSLEIMRGAFTKASAAAKKQGDQQAAAAKTAGALTKATKTAATALNTETAVAKAATVNMMGTVDATARQARQAGISAGAVSALIKILKLTPSSVSTTFNMDIQAALDRLAQLRAAIAATLAMQNDRNSPALVAMNSQVAALEKQIPGVKASASSTAATGGTDLAPGAGGSGGSKPPGFDKSTLTSFLQTATNKSSNPLSDALAAILTSAKAAGKKLSAGFTAALSKDNTRLKTLVADRTALATKLSAAEDKLSAVRDLYNGVKSSTASAFSSTFDVTNVSSPFGDQALSGSDEVKAADKAAANATQFLGLLKQLTKEGLDKNIVAQLAAAGPGAMAAAKAFSKMTPAQVAKENADYKIVANASNSAGTFMADQMYGAGVKSAMGLVNGLKSQQSELNAAITKLAEGMIAALKKKLDIHSPSRVTHWIGQMTGLGMVHGMRSQIGAINEESINLAHAAVPDNGDSDFERRNGGRSGGLGDRPIVLKAYGPDARSVTRSFEERLKSGRL